MEQRSTSAEGLFYGRRGRLGAIIPANNSVIEPEWWSVLPDGVALHSTRILAEGDLTPDAVRAMEGNVNRAARELAATGVDVIAYCDMVTTFIMEPRWNEAKAAHIATETRTPAISAWTALRMALARLEVTRFALGTPYPAAIHALAPPFFAALGYEVVADATLDIVKMRDVCKVTPAALTHFAARLDHPQAQALVLLATDLPTFAVLTDLERRLGRPVLTSNQTLLWSALRTARNEARLPNLGQLLEL